MKAVRLFSSAAVWLAAGVALAFQVCAAFIFAGGGKNAPAFGIVMMLLGVRAACLSLRAARWRAESLNLPVCFDEYRKSCPRN